MFLQSSVVIGLGKQTKHYEAKTVHNTSFYCIIGFYSIERNAGIIGHFEDYEKHNQHNCLNYGI